MTQTTASTCCYCGVGCGVLIEHDQQRILGVSGDPQHPANLGRLCSKGASLHQSSDPAARLLHPQLRLGKGLARSRIDWDSALDHAAEVIGRSIAEHGPDSVAFYVSGQLLTEDYYVFNKLARALVGTHNIDSNSRLCMSSAVVGYKRSLGADAPPCSYEDIEQSDCVLIAGSNMANAHPVLFGRLREAKSSRPEMRVIVIDPRRSETCELADLHLALQPGTDVALFHGILHILLWEGWIDREFIEQHTEGFDALKALVRDYTPTMVSELCGIHQDDLQQAARLIGSAPRLLSLWCMGLNQSTAGSAKNNALINLHLATGQIGKPGSGPFSLTGQPNAMGGRETGTLANLLPGHRDAGNLQHLREVADYWGIPALPERPGLSAIELFEAVRNGRIKALWIACSNPAQSLPDQQLVQQALAICPFVVVQEAFATSETCQFADLLLPAASWGEKDGMVTSSERRISHVRAAIAPPGEARPDWQIAGDLAQRLEKQLRPGQRSLFAFDNPAQIYDEYKGLTAGRDLDCSGISHELIDRLGPQQWPFPAGAGEGRTRLYTDAQFPSADGRARFVAEHYQPPREKREARYPLLLNTGRLRDQWHGMTRTGTVARLFGSVDRAQLHLNPGDMTSRRLREGQLMRVSSRRGNLVLPLHGDPAVASGQAFLPMHWGDRFLKGLGVNVLTQPAFDPLSKQPELKQSAIRLDPVDLPWSCFLLVEGDVQQRFNALRPLFESLDYAAFALTGNERPALVVRAAHASAADSDWLEQIDRLLGVDQGPVLAYDDPRRAIGKRVRIEQQRIQAIRLSGETLAADWLLAAWQSGEADSELRRWFLAPFSSPPGGARTEADRTLCSCMDVRQSAIHAGLQRGLDLPGLQRELRCGNGCGSCLAEIRQLVDRHQQAAQAATQEAP